MSDEKELKWMIPVYDTDDMELQLLSVVVGAFEHYAAIKDYEAKARIAKYVYERYCNI